MFIYVMDIIDILNRKKRYMKNESFLSNLRIADLELFISAANLNNLGKAAKLHNLSQSAASTAIQRVEAAFGEDLCSHEKRQFSLTKEGSLLLPRAEAWLRHLRENVVAKELQPIRLVTTHAIARVSIPAVLPMEVIDLKLMRPDSAYGAILKGEADVALVLDNSPWEGVVTAEIGKGYFQLFSKQTDAPKKPVLLPEDQIEVLILQQKWQQIYKQHLPIKARLPSWSLIADICSRSDEVGFLPDFLAVEHDLYPVSWQPAASRYRLLALYQKNSALFEERLDPLLQKWKNVFSHH